MAWIPSHQELSRHPKTLRLARQMGQTVPETMGQLHLLWHWCMDFAQDGDLSRHDFADVAYAMMPQAEPQKLRAALLDCGFLDEEGARLTVHDWNEYGGKLILEKRAQARRKKERRKKAELTSATCQQDVSKMSVTSNLPVTVMSAPAVLSGNGGFSASNGAVEADFGIFSCPPDVRGMSGGREEERRREKRRKQEKRGEERRERPRRARRCFGISC